MTTTLTAATHLVVSGEYGCGIAWDEWDLRVRPVAAASDADAREAFLGMRHDDVSTLVHAGADLADAPVAECRRHDPCEACRAAPRTAAGLPCDDGDLPFNEEPGR
jgi:hypothetical protein